MAAPDRDGGTGERFALAALDHFLAASGYVPVPEARPGGGGFRRLYLRDGAEPCLAAVGGGGGRFVSLGVEFAARRDRVHERAHALTAALAPYEVAIDPDAGADPAADDAVVRLALRLFPEGLTGRAVADAVGTLTEAAAEARRLLV
jgi:hypothetical protein